MLEQKMLNLMDQLRNKAELGHSATIRNPIRYNNRSYRLTVEESLDEPMVWDALVKNAMAYLNDVQDVEIIESTLYKHPGLRPGTVTYEWYIGYNALENQLTLW